MACRLLLIKSVNTIVKPTIAGALAWAIKELKDKSASAALDAEVLLCFILKKEKTFLYTYPEKTLTPFQFSVYKKNISRRKKAVPIAYIINRQEFYGLDFYIDKRVLVPRPETEQLIEIVQVYTKKSTSKLTIADIGTGSGCIAITLKKLHPALSMLATDISEAALTVAKKNAKKHGVKIIFKRGYLLTPLVNQPINILIANLPYVPTTDKKISTLFTKSLKFEPSRALYAGQDGLTAYKKLLQQINHRKQKPAQLILEHDPRHAHALQKITRATGYKVKQHKDLSGRNRFVVATRD